MKACYENDRIHTLFEICIPNGRVQSTSPNIQNIQKEEILSNFCLRSLFDAPIGMSEFFSPIFFKIIVLRDKYQVNL